MESYNNLNATLITNKCNEAIHNLHQDVEDNEMVLTNLQGIEAENKLSGEAISAFKNMLADYYVVTQLNVEADECDIADLNTLLSNVTESLYGNVIVPAHNKAQADRDEYRRLASEQRRNSQYFNPVVIPYASGGSNPIENPYETNAKRLDSLADGCEIERLKWENKMKLYDQIEANTANLLQNGKEIRNIVQGMLAAMDKQCISGSYDQMVATECLSKNGWIEYLEKINGDSTYAELKYEALCEKYPELGTYLENEKKINDYYSMIPNVPDSEKKKIMDEIDKLKTENEQLLVDIGSRNPDFAFLSPSVEYMKSIGMESASIDEILVYWLSVGDPKKLAGIELPTGLMIDVDKSLALVQWKVEGNPIAASNQFYKELGVYLIISGVINGEDFSTSADLQEYLKKQWKEQVLDNIDYWDMMSDIESAKPTAISFIFSGAANWVGANFEKTWWKTGNDFWQFILEYANMNGLPTSTIQAIYEVGIDGEAELDEQAVDAFMKGIAGKSGKDCNNAYNILARFVNLNMIDENMVKEHYELNTIAWGGYKKKYGKTDCILKDGKQYIEHQNNFTSDYIGSNLYYGKYIKGISDKCMARKDSAGNTYYRFDSNGLYGASNTCEIIATYNVLTHLGMDVEFPDIIKDFEENSPILGGNFGSAPDQYAGYIEAMGYETITYDVGEMNHNVGQEDDYTKMLEECDSIIISEWNTDSASNGMHTMAITIDKEEQADGTITYTITRHNDDNVYSQRYDKDGLYELINEYTKGNGAEPMKVLGIKAP